MASVYRPPNSPQSEPITEYENLVKSLQSRTKKLLISLDHNLDLLKADKHAFTQNFLDQNIDSGLMPCITKPTRITHETATLIDNIILSSSIYDGHQSYILTEDLSDHLPCLVTLPGFDPLRKGTSMNCDQEIKFKKPG